jgi:nucleoid-associated protein YgaU
MKNVIRTGVLVLTLSAGSMMLGCSYGKDSPSQANGYRGDARADVLTPSEPVETLPPVKPAPAPEPIVTPAPQVAPAPVAPAPSAAPVTYTVKQGDNLWQIAKAHYGDGQKWKQIVDANPGLNPDKLPVGKKIVLP